MYGLGVFAVVIYVLAYSVIFAIEWQRAKDYYNSRTCIKCDCLVLSLLLRNRHYNSHTYIECDYNFVNVLPPIEVGASCFMENSTVNPEELLCLTLSPQA